MRTVPARRIHVRGERRHATAGIRLHELLHRRLVPHVRHHPFRHADKAVAGIDAPFGADSKGVAHAVDERSDAPPAGEDAPAEVVDVHHLDLSEVVECFVEKEDEQLTILRRIQCPLFRVL